MPPDQLKRPRSGGAEYIGNLAIFCTMMMDGLSYRLADPARPASGKIYRQFCLPDPFQPQRVP